MSDTAGTGASRDEGGSVLPPACAAVDADLAELALGVLTGKERQAVLAHLEDCPRCNAEVEQLAACGDQLLALTPSVQPPVGFEGEIFARLGLQPTAAVVPLRARPRPWARWAAAAVAAVVLVGGGVGLARAVGTGDNYDAVSKDALQHVALDSGDTQVGSVMVYAGNPTWLFMYMDDPAWKGALRCEVVVEDGPTVSLGRFWLSGGKGAWAASTGQPAGRLAEALVVAQDGQVLARARLN